MRIAFVSHFYPPSACGGVGYFTAALAEGAQKAGMKVGVLCVDRWGEGNRYFNGFADDMYNGVPVRRLHINWQKAPRPFDWLFDSPVVGELAREYLDHFQPDVVHVSSCYALSARPVFVAKGAGLPVVMHLHDYWVICARHTLLHKDYTLCKGPDTTWGCQRCLLSGARSWRLVTRVANEATAKAVFEELAKKSWFTRQPSLRGMLGDLERRRQVTLGATEVADILITPTHFAKRVLEQHGVSAGRIVVKPCGNRIDWARGIVQVPSKYLRIGFLGNVLPQKGVHILVEAFERLLRDHPELQLQIWGDTSLAPQYSQSIRYSSSRSVQWYGRYSPADLPRVMSQVDVIVVPSIWYETQGIVIQEAFAAGVPVVVSKGTSLAETVAANVNGLHFAMGSVEDLVSQLQRIIDRPQILERLRSNIPPVRRIEDDVNDYRRLYMKLRQGALPTAPEKGE